MKKLLLFILVFPFALLSYIPEKVEVYAGAGISRLNISNFEGTAAHPRRGFLLGGEAKFRLTESFFINTGIAIKQDRFGLDHYDPSFYDGDYSNLKSYYAIDYFVLPISVSFHFYKTKNFETYVSGGLMMSYILQSQGSEYKTFDYSNTEKGFIATYIYETKPDMRKYEMNVSISCGIYYSFIKAGIYYISNFYPFPNFDPDYDSFIHNSSQIGLELGILVM